MITEVMRLAGWRECPADEVWKAWLAKGGEWEWMGDTGSPQFGIYGLPKSMLSRISVRPVHPSTWDYCPQGWGSVVPTEPGLWWVDWCMMPVEVYLSHGELWCMCCGEAVDIDTAGGWLAPCIKPGVV